jgi:class 3 adenylate cyclase
MSTEPASLSDDPSARPAGAAPVAAWLEDAAGGIHPILGVYRIGRSPNSDLCLDFPSVSRHHALLDPQGRTGMRVIDLDSRNGTLVNGRRITAAASLVDGDEMAIGSERFVFHQVGGPAPGKEEYDTIGEPTRHQERRESCFLLMGDLRGFSKLAQTLSPGELTGLLGGWMSTCKGIIEDHAGCIDKYQGDGFLAYWRGGASAGAAVAATVADFRGLPEDTPGFRIVIHFGEIGLGAAATRCESILPGSEVNFIFRMEKAAAHLGVDFCFSAAARQALEGKLPMKPVPGEHALKDFAGHHRFFQPA